MRTFLVEGYLAGGTAEQLHEFRTAASHATQEMARDGTRVVYLSSVFLPADQTCLGLFQASDREHVSEVCDRAGIPCDRITEALLGPRGAVHTERPPGEREDQ